MACIAKSVVSYFCLLPLIACAGAPDTQPEELVAAKGSFASLTNPTEADRQKYITELAKLRDALARNGASEDCFKVDATIRRHPAPANTEGYTKLMVGEWSSPRHEYLYRTDGTWSMLPEEDGTTRGRWCIEGNQFFSKADIETEDPKPYTILLLTKDNFICTDGDIVFYTDRIRDDTDEDNRR